MKPRSPFHMLAAVLCVVALLVAQSFGARVSFICDCGGKPVSTESSHCHGPHHDDCHLEDAPGNGHSESGLGDRKDHQVVKEDAPMRPAEFAKQAAAPVVFEAPLPEFEISIVRFAPVQPACVDKDAGDSPPPPLGVTVARTVVFLI